MTDKANPTLSVIITLVISFIILKVIIPAMPAIILYTIGVAVFCAVVGVLVLLFVLFITPKIILMIKNK